MYFTNDCRKYSTMDDESEMCIALNVENRKKGLLMGALIKNNKKRSLYY